MLAPRSTAREHALQHAVERKQAADRLTEFAQALAQMAFDIELRRGLLNRLAEGCILASMLPSLLDQKLYQPRQPLAGRRERLLRTAQARGGAGEASSATPAWSNGRTASDAPDPQLANRRIRDQHDCSAADHVGKPDDAVAQIGVGDGEVEEQHDRAGAPLQLVVQPVKFVENILVVRGWVRQRGVGRVAGRGPPCAGTRQG